MNKAQRDAVRRGTNVWGFVIAAAEIVLSVVLPYIYLFAQRMGFNTQAPVTALVLQMILSVTVMTVPFVISASVQKVRVMPLIRIKRIKSTLFFPLVMIGIGGAMLANNLTNEFTSVLNLFGFNPQAGSLELPTSIGGTVLFVIASAVIPALFEEFAYRGVMLGALRKFGDGFAIIASALMFGLMHGNFVQIPFAFMLGCLMGYINVVSGSIWPSVTVHFFNNMLSVIQQMSYTYLGNQIGSVIVVISFCLALLLGISGFAMLCKMYRKPFAPLPGTDRTYLVNALIGFATCPGTIAAYIIFGGNALVSMLSYTVPA